MRSPFRTAGRFGTWLLDSLGAAGIVSPWGLAYIHPAYRECLPTLRHELIHLQQMRRDGRVRWWLTYMWEWAVFGYDGIGYEQDAYRGQQ